MSYVITVKWHNTLPVLLRDTLSSAKRLTATGEELIISLHCSALLETQDITKHLYSFASCFLCLNPHLLLHLFFFTFSNPYPPLCWGYILRINKWACHLYRAVFNLPVRDSKWFHLFIQMPMQHVFVAGDPQGFGHGVGVKRWIQSHQSSMDPFTLKIVCKLLKSKTEVLCTCVSSTAEKNYFRLDLLIYSPTNIILIQRSDLRPTTVMVEPLKN